MSEVLRRAPELAVQDGWLAAGVLFQTVWNRLTGRPAGTGIRDADLFYLDADTSWDAEDAVIRRGEQLFGDLPVPVEIRNQARVHLWYADHFGAPPPAPFRSCTEAIDSFAAVCCSVGVTLDGTAARGCTPRTASPTCSTWWSGRTARRRRGTSTRPRRPAGSSTGRSSPCCRGTPTRLSRPSRGRGGVSRSAGCRFAPEHVSVPVSRVWRKPAGSAGPGSGSPPARAAASAASRPGAVARIPAQ